MPIITRLGVSSNTKNTMSTKSYHTKQTFRIKALEKTSRFRAFVEKIGVGWGMDQPQSTL